MILIFKNSYINSKQHKTIRSNVLFYVTFIHANQYIQKFTDLYKHTSQEITQPRSQLIFSLSEEGEKEALEHFKHVIKVCPNRGHIFSE